MQCTDESISSYSFQYTLSLLCPHVTDVLKMYMKIYNAKQINPANWPASDNFCKGYLLLYTESLAHSQFLVLFLYFFGGWVGGGVGGWG